MKFTTLLFSLLLISNTSTSQSIFEKGYFIDNGGDTTICLIKNKGWKNNPSQIRYKSSEKSKTTVETIDNIKEFGIDGFSKYERHEIKIDTASDKLEKLTPFR